MTPLAERLRPTTLESYFGQKHLVGSSGTLSRLMKQGKAHVSCLLGPARLRQRQKTPHFNWLLRFYQECK